MATEKSIRPVPAPARKLARVIKLTDEQEAHLHHDLMGARAAVMTAILALEHGGVHEMISNSLRMHVLYPLGRVESALTGEEVRP